MAKEIKLGDEYIVPRAIVEAMQAVTSRKWNDLKKIMNSNRELVPEMVERLIDMNQSTVLHKLAGELEFEVLNDLLTWLKEVSGDGDNRVKKALETKDNKGNTILHEVANADQERQQNYTIPTLNVIIKHNPSCIPDLLVLKNEEDETPLFSAAKNGNLPMLKYLHHKYILSPDLHFPPAHPSFHETLIERPVLHSCSINFKFEVAVWLLNNVDDRNYDSRLALQQATEKIGNNFISTTCLEQLSRMPLAFKSKANEAMGNLKKLIYFMLPNKRYKSDEELDQPRDETTQRQLRSISWINNAFWKHVAKGLSCIDEIWDKKETHKFANDLVGLLIKNINMGDIMEECSSKSRAMLDLSQGFLPNVTEKKNQIELKNQLTIKIELKDEVKKKIELKDEVKKKQMEIVKQKTKKKEKEIKDETEDGESSISKKEKVGTTKAMGATPLLVAAAMGIKEVVKIWINKDKSMSLFINEDGYNILHIVAKHRQWKIYEFILEQMDKRTLTSLLQHIAHKDGRTILHQAATMEYFREQQLAGVAYQLQHELHWFHKVRSGLPRQYLMHVDKDGLTANDLLEIEHVDMHGQAKQWMKDTAQSCSTVAVLIAGVVFAAAYAIPGGNDNGKPKLLKKSAFRVFTVMDVLALSCSLGSVVMFLSILTSSFDLWDFHKSLPLKLQWGFILLFLSLMTTMVAFAATILLTIHLESHKKTTIFAYSLAFIIISIFGITQFPMHKMLGDLIIRFWKFCKKIMIKVNKK